MGGCTCAARLSLPEHEPPEVIKDGETGNAQVVRHKRREIHDAYAVEREPLAQGAFGEVHRATSRATGNARAAKVPSKRRGRHVERLRREARVMESLDHPNIVKLVETFESRKQVHLVLELCEGGSLLTRLIQDCRFKERRAAGAVQQILRGLAYLHARCLVHCNLTLESVLLLHSAPLPNNVLKIAGFGLACKCSGKELLTAKVGTPLYVAPEVLSGKGYNRQRDMWSVGVVTFFLLCGHPASLAADDQTAVDDMCRWIWACGTEVWPSASGEAKRFVSSLLRASPRQRPTSEKALSEEWLTRMVASEEVVGGAGSAAGTCACNSTEPVPKAANEVVDSWLDDIQVCDARCAFEAMDVDGDGQPSSTELCQGLKRCGLPEPKVSKPLEGMQANSKGATEYTGFPASLLERSQCLGA